MKPSDVKGVGPLRISASSCFSPPTRRRPGGVFMWAAGRWCSAASGRRSGRSCWTGCSCSPLQTAAPDRPEPAARRRAGAGGRQHGGPGRRGVDVGTNPSAPPWKTEVKDCYNGLFHSKTWTHVLLPNWAGPDHPPSFIYRNPTEKNLPYKKQKPRAEPDSAPWSNPIMLYCSWVEAEI